LNIAQPDFYGRFFCIGAACEDTCCSGMGVVVDKATYNRYQACEDPALKPLFQLKVLPNAHSTNPASFATIKMEGPDCPFLQADKDCAIQSQLGSEYLSRTCDTYPRAYSRVDNVLERSLYLSCPEAARIILLRSSEIRFSLPGEGHEEKYTEFPTVETDDELVDGKPYKHFGLVRSFVMRLLRNRNYKVWERLVILGMYCDQLTRIPAEELLIATPVLTNSFNENLAARAFDQTLAGIQSNQELLLNVTINSLEDRIKSDYTSPRFIGCYNQFIEGIGYRPGIQTSELATLYSAAKTNYYKPFMDSREFVWENYLVSKVYKDLFPFGPQKSLYQQARSIYQEYVILVFQYILSRTLLIGVAGHLKEDISQSDIVLVIQSFARAFEHNPTYLGKILLSLELGKIGELATLARLIKP